MARVIGITRTVDEVGRVTIPKDVRAMLGINCGDTLECFVDQDAILFRPWKENSRNEGSQK